MSSRRCYFNKPPRCFRTPRSGFDCDVVVSCLLLACSGCGSPKCCVVRGAASDGHHADVLSRNRLHRAGGRHLRRRNDQPRLFPRSGYDPQFGAGVPATERELVSRRDGATEVADSLRSTRPRSNADYGKVYRFSRRHPRWPPRIAPVTCRRDDLQPSHPAPTDSPPPRRYCWLPARVAPRLRQGCLCLPLRPPATTKWGEAQEHEQRGHGAVRLSTLPPLLGKPTARPSTEDVSSVTHGVPAASC